MAPPVKSGAEWQAKAVRELTIPDSFSIGEECHVGCPFKEGDIVESRSFQGGFRGAWFLVEVM